MSLAKKTRNVIGASRSVYCHSLTIKQSFKSNCFTYLLIYHVLPLQGNHNKKDGGSIVVVVVFKNKYGKRIPFFNGRFTKGSTLVPRAEPPCKNFVQ